MMEEEKNSRISYRSTHCCNLLSDEYAVVAPLLRSFHPSKFARNHVYHRIMAFENEIISLLPHVGPLTPLLPNKIIQNKINKRQTKNRKQMEETAMRIRKERADRDAVEKARRLLQAKQEVAKRALNQERMRLVRAQHEAAIRARDAARSGSGAPGTGTGAGAGVGSSAGTMPIAPSAAPRFPTAGAAGGVAVGGGSNSGPRSFSTGGGGTAEIIRTTKMVSVLPPGLDESSPQVSKIYDKNGRWKLLYRISTDVATGRTLGHTATNNGVAAGGGGAGGASRAGGAGAAGVSSSSSSQGRGVAAGSGRSMSPHASPAAQASGGSRGTGAGSGGMMATLFGAPAGVGRSSAPVGSSRPTTTVASAGAAGGRSTVNGGGVGVEGRGGGGGGGGGGKSWDISTMKKMMRLDADMAASQSEDGVNLKNVSVPKFSLVVICFPRSQPLAFTSYVPGAVSWLAML